MQAHLISRMLIMQILCNTAWHSPTQCTNMPSSKHSCTLEAYKWQKLQDTDQNKHMGRKTGRASCPRQKKNDWQKLNKLKSSWIQGKEAKKQETPAVRGKKRRATFPLSKSLITFTLETERTSATSASWTVAAASYCVVTVNLVLESDEHHTLTVVYT